jgi:hypothetical protein
VRALVQQPGPMSWRLLGELLDVWPDARERDEVIVPYCLDSLRAWPERLRVAPLRWVGRAMKGEPPAALALCTRITIDDTLALVGGLDPLFALELPALTHLSFRSWTLNQRVLRRLLSAPLCAGLTSLDLYDHRLNEALWDMLLGWERLPQLHHLGLERCRLTPRWDVREAAPAGGLVLLSRLLSLKLPALVSLNLRDNKLREEDMEAMAEAPALVNVRTLLLGACPADPNHADRHTYFNRAGEAGVRALATGASLAQLEALELSYHQLTDDAIRPLLDAPPAALARLDLHLNHLRGASGKALAASGLMAQLDALDISGVPIGASSIAPMLAASPDGKLRELRLSRVKLGQAGARALGAARNLSGLERLEIAENKLSIAELTALLQSLHAPRLAHLNIARQDADPALVSGAIAGSPSCQALRSVQLGPCNPHEAAALLASPDQLTRLERVSFAPYRTNDRRHVQPPEAAPGPRDWLLDRMHPLYGDHLLTLTDRMLEP